MDLSCREKLRLYDSVGGGGTSGALKGGEKRRSEIDFSDILYMLSYVYTTGGVYPMRKVKKLRRLDEPRKTMVFKSGNSLAVRLPNYFHFSVGPVIIFMRNDEVVIRKAKSDMAQAFKLLTELPDDFMKDGRQDLPSQKRKF